MSTQHSSNSTAPNGSAGVSTLLDFLRSESTVDVDSLDSYFAETLAPFVDATSNQAIAFGELSKPTSQGVLSEAAQLAVREAPNWPEMTLPGLAVEIAQVLLALRIRPFLTGRFHIQSNPLESYSTAKTVECGRRLSSLVAKLASSPEVAGSLCVKIPATWEGLMACRELENERDIRTLATTLFTMEQGVLAGEVGCTYIAPYVNELPVHFVPGHVDPAPNNQLVVDIQRYYELHGVKTQVLPASLTTPEECLYLAGAQHITIAPALLQALATTPAPPAGKEMDAKYPSLFRQTPAAKTSEKGSPLSFIKDEARFKNDFEKRDDGRQAKKLVDAIRIFSEMQEKLEALLGTVLKQTAAAAS